MSNKNKSNYTAYNIYSRIKGEDTGEDAKKAPEATAKSIYAKNSNMFLKGVGVARAGIDAGLKTQQGSKKAKNSPPADDTNGDDNNDKGTDLTEDIDLSGGSGSGE